MKGGTPRSRTLWTFVVTSLALVMVTLDNLVVTTALPVIRKDLGTGVEGLEWTVNAYTLTFAVLLLTGAALGDRFGRRRLFAIGLGIFTVASAVAALAPSIEVLVAARAVQGLGGAIITPLTLTILSAAVPAEKRGVALGAWGGIGGLAVALGPLVGGAVVSGLSWHWIFWINVPIGLVMIPLALRRLDETRGPSNRLDLPGLGLASAGLLGIVWGLVRGNGQGWTSPGDRRLAGGRSRAGDRLRALGAQDRDADAADAVLPQPHVRADERRLAADVLRDVRLDLPARAVLPDRSGLLALRLGAAHPPVDGDADLRRADRRGALRPDRRTAADGDRPGAAGDRPRLDGRVSTRRPRPTPTSSPRSCSRGSGMALFFAPVANVVLSSVRPEEEGQASGANNAIRELGGVFGVAVLASIFSHYGGYGSGDVVRRRAEPGDLGRRRRRRGCARRPRLRSRGGSGRRGMSAAEPDLALEAA